MPKKGRPVRDRLLEQMKKQAQLRQGNLQRQRDHQEGLQWASQIRAHELRKAQQQEHDMLNSERALPHVGRQRLSELKDLLQR